MKVHEGHKICDLFSLNYTGSTYCSVKRDNKNGIQFVPSKHANFFATLVEIYKDAKKTHGIIGLVPMILAKDETNVRSRVCYKQRFDPLVRFCRPKETHICILHYKPLVGIMEGGYNKILEYFHFHKIGGFARVVVMSPLY